MICQCGAERPCLSPIVRCDHPMRVRPIPASAPRVGDLLKGVTVAGKPAYAAEVTATEDGYKVRVTAEKPETTEPKEIPQ